MIASISFLDIHIVFRYALGVAMSRIRLGTWLGWLRATSTFVLIAAMCLAVAVLVIAFIPGSPVTQDLPSSALTGLHSVGGVTAGVAVDPAGWVPFTIHDPSLEQRLLALLPVLPGLVLVAEIARRMANLLRAAQASDPFTASTARALLTIAKITALGGLAVWVVSQIGQWLLSRTMLTEPVTVKPPQSPLGWLAVGLIFAALAQIIDRGVAMRAELDTVI
jgi:hypothetical protein